MGALLDAMGGSRDARWLRHLRGQFPIIYWLAVEGGKRKSFSLKL